MNALREGTDAAQRRAAASCAASGVCRRQDRAVCPGAVTDDDLAQAIIDRVLERGRLLRIPSVRTLHVNLDDAMKEDSDQQTEVARISGKQWPEFSEPTHREIRVDPWLP